LPFKLELKPMQLSVYTVCYNEQKLLPHFLRHYARLAQKIIVWDNGSTDDSLRIIRSFPHPNLHIGQFDTGGQMVESALVEIKNNCWKGDTADFVIVCDVDEFLFVPDLQRFLAEHAACDIFRPRGYDMVADEFPQDDGRLLVERVKRGVPNALYSKAVLFRPQRVREINYRHGCHSCDPVGQSRLLMYDGERYPGNPLLLCHYKNLGVDHRLEKHRMLGARLGAEFEKFGFGYHYKLDDETQKREFDDLRRRATQILP